MQTDEDGFLEIEETTEYFRVSKPVYLKECAMQYVVHNFYITEQLKAELLNMNTTSSRSLSIIYFVRSKRVQLLAAFVKADQDFVMSKEISTSRFDYL